MKDPIFEPITINNLKIKNRIYLPAMHLGMANNFEVTDRIINFYAQRAKGGPGIICAGYATIDELSGNTQNIGAHDDKFIPGLKKLSKVIKDNGSLSAIQINHAGRYNFSFFLNGEKPVAPSPIASRMTKETPKEMTSDEIKTTINSFAQAASRVKRAGFDAVEVLSGTGYLISEFLSPLTNQRTDKYGGSFKNRMRFGLEVVEAVRDTVGKDFPLIVRMNGNDFMPGGNSKAELKEYAKILSEGLVDALCINVGWHEARVPQIVASVPGGAFSYLARGIKEKVKVPVIASHRINDPKIARQLLEDGMCDMVAMGRSLIADPMLPEKTRLGKENEIVHCIACAQGCFDNLFKLKHVECLCNPLAGHEADKPFKKASSPKKVLVAGAGPAGMTAAITARLRGHDVTIYESAARPGGQLYLAAAPPGREEFARLAKDLETQVAVNKIPLVLKTKLTEEIIRKENPDAIIVASGAKPLIPPIPGINLPHVAESWDVLQGKAVTGKKIAIIGGGAVGVETALFLSEKGTLPARAVKFLLVNRAEDPETLFKMATLGTKKVTLIEMLDKLGKDIGKSTRWGMMQELSRHHIKTMTGSKVIEITPKGLNIEQDGDIHEIEADTVVIAAGSVPYNTLEPLLKKMDVEFKIAGDARQVATAFHAVHQGYKEAGLEI
ncbi:MAG: FAD-dependent oxidoreductase [Deltaproteobacteria bacterium]|nr:FAD-dependent oxidoreductase [Deltaproteobacteria bacterium]